MRTRSDFQYSKATECRLERLPAEVEKIDFTIRWRILKPMDATGNSTA